MQHRLLLVQDDPVGRADDRLQALVGDRDQIRVALAARVGRDLLHGARAVERHERDEVVELRRLDLAQRLLHALGLELEDAHGVAGGEHLIGLLVVERQLGHVGPLAGRAADDVQRVLDDVEVAQAQEVHLEQAELLDGLHRELRDLPVDLVARRVGLVRVCQLQRDDVGQRHARDDDRSRVDRVVADDALEALGDVDDLLGDRVLVVLGAERLALLEAVLEARRATHDRVRDQLGELVALAVLVAEHAGGVARRRAREHLAEGDDLRDRLAAVLLDDVLHHALTAADGEVDVDVRHRHALGVEEALEEQVVAQRIEVGDPQGVGDDRAGGRAAARADRDAVVLRPLDEVPHDQEVGVEAHRVDDAELELHALRRPRPAAAGRSGRACPPRRGRGGRPSRPRPRAGSAGSAAGRARSRRCSARPPRACSGSRQATRRTSRPSPPTSAGRTRWCRRSSSARRAWTSSARRAAPCGGGSPRGAGSGRRRCRRACRPARGRS